MTKNNKVLRLITRIAYSMGVLFLVSGLSLSLLTKNVYAGFTGDEGENGNNMPRTEQQQRKIRIVRLMNQMKVTHLLKNSAATIRIQGMITESWK